MRVCVTVTCLEMADSEKMEIAQLSCQAARADDETWREEAACEQFNTACLLELACAIWQHEL